MKDLLIEAKNEIQRLRGANEILNAKVEVMDLFACVLHTQPAHRTEGQAVDVAWKLQNGIDEMAMKRADHKEN